MRTGSSPLGLAGSAGTTPGPALPIISINTATYWQALRVLGIKDKLPGFGPLLARF